MLSQANAERALVGARLTQCIIDKYQITFQFDNCSILVCETEIKYHSLNGDSQVYDIQTQIGAPFYMDFIELSVTNVAVSAKGIHLFLEENKLISIAIRADALESGRLIYGDIYAIF